jgi:hypothetical protein
MTSLTPDNLRRLFTEADDIMEEYEKAALMLSRACVALARTVNVDRPAAYSYSEYADTFAEGLTPVELEALRTIEHILPGLEP